MLKEQCNKAGCRYGGEVTKAQRECNLTRLKGELRGELRRKVGMVERGNAEGSEHQAVWMLS